jgi:hypothetical protein
MTKPTIIGELPQWQESPFFKNFFKKILGFCFVLFFLLFFPFLLFFFFSPFFLKGYLVFCFLGVLGVGFFSLFGMVLSLRPLSI